MGWGPRVRGGIPEGRTTPYLIFVARIVAPRRDGRAAARERDTPPTRGDIAAISSKPRDAPSPSHPARVWGLLTEDEGEARGWTGRVAGMGGESWNQQKGQDSSAPPGNWCSGSFRSDGASVTEPHACEEGAAVCGGIPNCLS